jgi:hypothetical protein
MNEIENLIKKFGEQYRVLITDSIQWLNEKEKEWNLDETIDREIFIKYLLSKES